MEWRDAEFGYSPAVGHGGVTFVLFPVVVRIFQVHFFHVFVAVGFGKHRSGSNGKILAVALDDALVGNGFIRDEPLAVDKQELRHFF